MSLPTHGANPHYFLKKLGVRTEKDVVDFSVNTNPLGSILDHHSLHLQELMMNYPDPNVTTLRQKLGETYDVSPHQVLVTNGAAEAFFLIAAHFSGKKALLLQPTFVEYKEACEAFQCEVHSLQLKEKENWTWPFEQLMDLLPSMDIVWICHPNNPTGMLYPNEQWELLLQKAKQHDVTVVIDEAFFDFTERAMRFESYINDYPVIVVRSMTKMFHIAGIRLGYIFAAPSLITALSMKQPPWSVNGVAQQVGEFCLENDEFVRQTVQFVGQEREWVQKELHALGLRTYPSFTNYYLCEIPKGWNGREWISYLAAAGVIVRHTENFQGLDGRYMRLAVKTRNENERLLAVFREGMAQRDLC
ncbi:threonine-phosphate decarboxylase CobD [Priestia koreensis]|uniref:threonine-phosphate decarboxylase CobD n=1 Tax=Priestia koreensis TaxID=284581 RepID=UPI001F5AFC84|nr:threonine-phosphate decarboxylase CobD [Priestia koreensis]UNL83669.1 threonine-phosphate decarboxylase [Priestia koreensis]